MHWWKKIPLLLSLPASYLGIPSTENDQWDFEPRYLQINLLEELLATDTQTFHLQNTKPASLCHWNKDNFQFLLEQFPTIQQLTFACEVADPFSLSQIYSFIKIAASFNHPLIEVRTPGESLEAQILQIVQSEINRLTLLNMAHRPSAYARITGRPLRELVVKQQNLDALLAQRQMQRRQNLEIFVEVPIDIHNYQEIPEIIHHFKLMGVDGVLLRNFFVPEQDRFADRTLYAEIQDVQRFFEQLQPLIEKEANAIKVQLPTLFKKTGNSAGNCMEPWQSILVDAAFNVSGCTQHRLTGPQSCKAWDEDCFNSESFQWLRQVHGRHPTEGEKKPIPLACQFCDKNPSA